MNPLLLLPMALAGPPAGPGCLPGAPPGLACPPAGPPAPVLAARVLAPPGVKVTVSPGTPDARTLDAPATVGLRPGYLYRLELTNLPGRPGEALYPVVEVRGSLVPRPGFNYMDFPAPVFLDPGDIEKAFAGVAVTKVVYLEDPTRAVPFETRPDQPIEFGAATEPAAVRAAEDNGRVVMVVRLGDRAPEADELARFAVPGTVLCPGEPRLPAPSCPPVIPCNPVPLFDPLLGPKPPAEECFTDGGDTGPRLGVRPDGRVGGLDPTDVALAANIGGKRRVVTSNVVCICSPRYAIRRVDTVMNGVQVATGPGAVAQLAGGAVTRNLVPVGAVANREKPVGAVSRLRPGITVVTQGVVAVVGLTAPQAVASVSGVRVTVGVVEPEEITNTNDLVVTKEVDPAGPVQPGDVVTFTLRYRNGTKLPATDLLLSDSLSGRLEYVPGSQASDRPANVTTAPNEAGSVVVRFEIPGPVPPGGTGVVRFQARVR